MRASPMLLALGLGVTLSGCVLACDGRITLGEFLATRKWKMGGPPGGPPPRN